MGAGVPGGAPEPPAASVVDGSLLLAGLAEPQVHLRSASPGISLSLPSPVPSAGQRTGTRLEDTQTLGSSRESVSSRALVSREE